MLTYPWRLKLGNPLGNPQQTDNQRNPLGGNERALPHQQEKQSGSIAYTVEEKANLGAIMQTQYPTGRFGDTEWIRKIIEHFPKVHSDSAWLKHCASRRRAKPKRNKLLENAINLRICRPTRNQLRGLIDRRHGCIRRENAGCDFCRNMQNARV